MAIKCKHLTQDDMVKYLTDKGEITKDMLRAILNGTMGFNFSARLVGETGKQEVIVDFNYWDILTATTS